MTKLSLGTEQHTNNVTQCPIRSPVPFGFVFAEKRPKCYHANVASYPDRTEVVYKSTRRAVGCWKSPPFW